MKYGLIVPRNDYYVCHIAEVDDNWQYKSIVCGTNNYSSNSTLHKIDALESIQGTHNYKVCRRCINAVRNRIESAPLLVEFARIINGVSHTDRQIITTNIAATTTTTTTTNNEKDKPTPLDPSDCNIEELLVKYYELEEAFIEVSGFLVDSVQAINEYNRENVGRPLVMKRNIEID